MKSLAFLALSLTLVSSCAAQQPTATTDAVTAATATTETVRVARWKDDKKAVFLLMFDALPNGAPIEISPLP